ncbi:MAG: hypothetical protein HKN57_12085 [Xanthomonadales bacterium]|nr:hypothetical protein [Gammaproteobacteria bacterium]MBT8053540.1 hypothetical protein [Gammaproteobacteria bacterium]NND57979.1 hypothetical protein [Xanthomonadales bacterium]NNK50855.1 hypothetical protein [Xanthomonadales bacterium]
MRFIIVLIIIALLVFKFWPEQPVPTAEESFIGPQIEGLKKAEQVEQQYMDALEKKNQRIERESDGGS